MQNEKSPEKKIIFLKKTLDKKRKMKYTGKAVEENGHEKSFQEKMKKSS